MVTSNHLCNYLYLYATDKMIIVLTVSNTTVACVVVENLARDDVGKYPQQLSSHLELETSELLF